MHNINRRNFPDVETAARTQDIGTPVSTVRVPVRELDPLHALATALGRVLSLAVETEDRTAEEDVAISLVDRLRHGLL